MSNGLYSNNSGLPTMTRSEYIAEYHDITTYFDKEKALCEIMKNCRIVNLLCAVCFAIFFSSIKKF